MNKKNIILLLISGIIMLSGLYFGLSGNFSFFENSTVNTLFTMIISRLSVALFFFVLLMILNKNQVSGFSEFNKSAMLSLPCFMVALVNFPYSALINGTLQITSPDLIWLFIIMCFSVSLMEEMVFRGVIQNIVSDYLKKNKYSSLLTIVITSVVFALIHLANLFAGGGIGYTLLQMGYSFLIGCMLSYTFIKTKNIWLCVLIHAIFDIGGELANYLGNGSPWDTVFWVLTIVSGVLAASHILVSLFKEYR